MDKKNKEILEIIVKHWSTISDRAKMQIYDSFKLDNLSNDDNKLIDDFLESKDLLYCKDDIIKTTQFEGCFGFLIELVKNKNITFPSTILTANKFCNIYDLINKNFPADVLVYENSFPKLAKLNKSKQSVTRGDFEIFINLIVTDTIKSTKGDIVTNVGVTELKSGGGRVCGQKLYSAIAIDNTIKEFLKQKDIKINLNKELYKKGVFHSQTSINTFFNELSTHMGVDKDVWFDLIEKAIYSQFKLKPNLDQNTRELIKNAIIPDDIKQSKRSKIVKVVDAKKLIKFMGCVQMSCYQIEEQWDHILIFEGKTGKEAIKNGNYICMSGEEASDIKLMFFNPNIKFDGGGCGNGGTRDNYCRVYYINNRKNNK